MNTTFFQKVTDLQGNFEWKDIFSDVFKPHTKEERDELLMTAIGNHIPPKAQMLKTWTKPWLFFRFGVIGVLLSVLIVFSFFKIATSLGIGALALVVPAFVIPLTAGIFFWEMNIPRDISIWEMLTLVLIGGIFSLTLSGFLTTFFTAYNIKAYLIAPITEETTKFLIVYLILKRSKYVYGIQGLLVGAAVGIGFSAIETAGYAWDAYDMGFSQFEALMDAGLGLAFSKSIWMQSLSGLLLLRSSLSIGGHVVWAAMYGGALALAKGNGKLKIFHITDKLVVITWCSAYLLHTFWNFDDYALLLRIFPERFVYYLTKLMAGRFGAQILATVLSWILLFYVMRRCIMQIIAVSRQYAAAAPAGAAAGRSGAAGGARALGAGGAAYGASSPFGAAGSSAGPAVYGGSPSYAAATAPVRPAPAGAAAGQAAVTVNGINGALQGRSFSLNRGGNLTFGRDPSRASVCFPEGTRGVSSLHCEITWRDGVPVLIDRNSTYGTFFGNGQKLEPGVPYKLQNGVRFCLAGEENQFRVQM